MPNPIDPKLQDWIVARKRHRLTHAQVQMARELGMNPKKLGKIDNHNAEPWKQPLPDFIESCYLKRFGRPPAEPIRSIEEISAAQQAKKKEKREMKAAKRSAAADPEPVGSRGPYPDRKISETILDFGAPLFDLLPPQPPVEQFRQFMTLVTAIWNVGTMAFPAWRALTGKNYDSELGRLLAQIPPEGRGHLDELVRRRASEPFREDQRAVGAWSIEPDGKGGYKFRCDAHFPTDPTKM